MSEDTRNPCGGGRFDPDATQKYFFATSQSAWSNVIRPVGHKDILIALNELRSVDMDIRPDEAVLLDSGVFALCATHAKANDMHVSEAFSLPEGDVAGFSALRTNFEETVRANENNLWGYIELDLGSADDKIARRVEMAEEGIEPIPVYSVVGDPWSYFEYLLENYSRVAIGSIAKVDRKQKEKVIAAVMDSVNQQEHPTWVHLLGCTPGAITNTFGPASMDSTSWARRGRYGVGVLYTLSLQGVHGIRNMRPPMSFIRYAGEGERPEGINDIIARNEAMQYSLFMQGFQAFRNEVDLQTT